MKPFAITAAVALVLGYLLGRYAAPTKTVVTDHVVTVDRQVVTNDTDKILNELRKRNTQNEIHTVRIIEHYPTGATKETTTTDDRSKSEASSEQQAKEKDHAVTERVVYQDRLVTKLVEHDKPNWSVELQPGLGLHTYFLPPPAVIGASITRRVLGPFFVGVWGSTAGAGGLAVRAEF